MGLKLADRMRGKAPEPANAHIFLSHENLQKQHAETRARVIQMEVWRNQLDERMASNNASILKAGEDRENRLGQTIEEVRRELDGKIKDVQHDVNSLPERIVKLFSNIQTLGGK